MKSSEVENLLSPPPVAVAFIGTMLVAAQIVAISGLTVAPAVWRHDLAI